MIGWFGPAVLLVLLAASNLPEPGVAGGSAATAVLAVDFGAPARPDVIMHSVTAATASRVVASLPRVQPRTRSVRGFGLPAPRPPTC